MGYTVGTGVATAQKIVDKREMFCIFISILNCHQCIKTGDLSATTWALYIALSYTIVIYQYRNTQPPTSVFHHPNRCSKSITGTPRKTCLCMKAAIPKGSDTLWPMTVYECCNKQQTKQMKQQNATLISSHPYVVVWQRSFCNFLKIKKTDLFCGW